MRLFQGLPEDTLHSIASRCAWRRCPAGELIVSRETREHEVYLLVSGTARVTAFSASGRQVTYRDLSAGDWFGDLAAVDHRPRSADVVAQTEALVACMRGGDFIDLVLQSPQVARALLEHLVQRVRELTDRVFELSTLGVQNRIDAEVLRLAKSAGVTRNAARIDPAPLHADVASQVSTNREQVTREISQLVKLGIVSRDGKALVVPDVARLERLVAEVRRTA
ncbi:MAG TPA: Crp/Fnr family transcriptional regulator [Steroidobacteraceae bacterium]